MRLFSRRPRQIVTGRGVVLPVDVPGWDAVSIMCVLAAIECLPETPHPERWSRTPW